MAHIAVFTLDETVEWDLQSVLSIPFLMIAGPIAGKKREIRFFLSGVGPKRKIKRGLNALHAYRNKLVRLDLGIFGLRVR
jgi:hypothetical protein